MPCRAYIIHHRPTLPNGGGLITLQHMKSQQNYQAHHTASRLLLKWTAKGGEGAEGVFLH